MGWGFSGDPIPSSVTTSLPTAALTGMMQVRTAAPLTSATHAPHWPRPQPNFGPRSSRSSLNAYRRGVEGLRSSAWLRPLTFSVILLIYAVYFQPQGVRYIRRAK